MLDLVNLLILMQKVGMIKVPEGGEKYSPGKVNREAKSLAGQLEEAFNSVGVSMMQDDFACKLLAYTLVLGSELCVLHKGLNSGIMIAQQKLGIFGGCVPNKKLLPLLQFRIKELETAARTHREFESKPHEYVDWIHEIYNRYEIGTNELKGKKKKVGSK